MINNTTDRGVAAVTGALDAGGGCGTPGCDYQVQCEPCFEASERQYAEWFRRAGHSRSTFRMVIDDMREAAHDRARAALDDNATRGGAR